jgi:hypothetical protein
MPTTVYLLERFDVDDVAGGAWWPVAVYASHEAATVAAMGLWGVETNIRPLPMAGE